MRTLLVFLFLPSLSLCQGFMPRWEMSLSADASSYSNRSGGHSYAAVAFRPGLFLVEGLSVEPELFVGAAKGQRPAYNLSGDLSYSYGMGHSVFVPFVLAGGGAGNGLTFSMPMQRTAKNLSVISVMNLGGGLKIMALGGMALIRLEYRYQKFYGQFLSGWDNVYARRLLVGFSVLL